MDFKETRMKIPTEESSEYSMAQELFQALETLLICLRNESPDDFADLFYSVASEVGVDFSQAGSYMDFMDVALLSEQLQHLYEENGLSPLWMVSGVLARVARWLSDEPSRARRQWRHNDAELRRNELPQALRQLSEETNVRLMSAAQERHIMAMRDRFYLERARLFSEQCFLRWEDFL